MSTLHHAAVLCNLDEIQWNLKLPKKESWSTSTNIDVGVWNWLNAKNAERCYAIHKPFCPPCLLSLVIFKFHPLLSFISSHSFLFSFVFSPLLSWPLASLGAFYIFHFIDWMYWYGDRKPISLISHSDVRYRGTLAGIDPGASTIQLSNGTPFSFLH